MWDLPWSLQVILVGIISEIINEEGWLWEGHQFACYRSIRADEGGNWYEAPHSGIRTKQSHGIEAVDLKVDRALITQAEQLVRN